MYYFLWEKSYTTLVEVDFETSSFKLYYTTLDTPFLMESLATRV